MGGARGGVGEDGGARARRAVPPTPTPRPPPPPSQCGYYEDRRPSSNLDPYVVCGLFVETTLLDG